jgi:hypothetical protein
MDKEINKQINQLTKASPYFKKFSQKRYSKVKGYIDHDSVTLHLARSLTTYEYLDGSFFEDDFIHRNSLVVLNKLYQDDFSSYWLTPELFNAFTKTTLPENIEHLKQIIPAGILMLPPVLKNPDGQPLKWVVFYHRRAEEKIPTIKIANGEIDIEHDPHDTLTWTTMLDDGSQYSGNVKVNNYNPVEANDYFFVHDIYKDANETTEKQFTHVITAIIFQTLLYLQIKPEEIKALSSHSSPRSKGNNKKRSPLMIGSNYQYKREDSNINKTGITKVTHWRRGFYRWQPYGKKDNPQHKLVWIEPTIVNG